MLSFALLSLIGITGVLGNNDGCDALKPLSISANGINATFLPFGARLTSLFVNDKDEVPRDIVVGYDDPEFYVRQAETKNAFVGGIVG